MSHWLYPANVKFYDVLGAFAQPKAFWPINSRVAVGDRIYLYLAAPYKQIGFVTEVCSVDTPHAAIVDQVRPFIKGTPPSGEQEKMFMLLKVLATVPIEPASACGYGHLKQNGLNGMLMGPRNLDNNPQLLNYIKEVTDGLRRGGCRTDNH